MLEFTFLGTSSGVPTLQRNVSGLAIRPAERGEWCLVDCGEGTQQQLLRTPHSLVKLEAIFITHVHGDHCYGLPGLLATASMAGRVAPLKIIAPEGVESFVRETIKYTDMRLTYDIEFCRTEEIDSISLGGFVVTPCALSHRVPSYAYHFSWRHPAIKLDVEKLQREGVPKGPLWGCLTREPRVQLEDGRWLLSSDYRLPQSPPYEVVVAGDNDTPELLAELCLSSQVLIHEATYTEEIRQKVGPGPQHSSAAQVARFAKECGLSNLVLTHFSARYSHPDQSRRSSISALEDEARSYYDGVLFLAEDFDCFRLHSGNKLVLESRIEAAKK